MLLLQACVNNVQPLLNYSGGIVHYKNNYLNWVYVKFKDTTHITINEFKVVNKIQSVYVTQYDLDRFENLLTTEI